MADEKEPTPASTDATPEPSAADATLQAKLNRFKALQARQKDSRKQNLKETRAETKRLATDPSALASLERKRETAENKLLKSETEDFERKRAWDWTAEESEKWDKRMEKKARHRDNVAFQDYRAEASKVYKRQLKEVPPNMEAYEAQKQEMIEKAVQRGGLELIESEDGEVILVDKDGTFYSNADSMDHGTHKPSKEAIDRLVGNIQKAEDKRMKDRRNRAMKDGRDDDVTYINAKNKQFNEKLGRFYDKYTSGIRESFERGTAI